MPITEEVRISTSQRTISTCVMYYSKFEQELSAFSKALIEWSLTRTEKQRKKSVGNSQKWSRSLTGAVAYESFSLQSFTTLVVTRAQVAYESGRKEDFDCSTRVFL